MLCLILNFKFSHSEFHSDIVCYHIYCFISTICILTPSIHYKLTYSPCVDQYSVHKMKQDIHLMCEEPATVTVYRADNSLSDAD